MSAANIVTLVSLDELDRDELLEILRNRAFNLHASDLLRARWKVASRRTKAAMDASFAAEDKWMEAMVAFNTPGKSVAERGRHATRGVQLRREKDKLERAYKRAIALEEALWAALEASR
jgi:hypothetical protein